MLTSNKSIYKIGSLQKKTIRLLMGLPRISHTVEAFCALNMLPFRKLGIFHVIKFLFQFKGDQLPPTLKKYFTSKNIKNPQPTNSRHNSEVSQTKFTRPHSWWFFDKFDICYGAPNKVVKQDLKNGKDLNNICTK